MEMPSRKEQEIAERYVLERELVRPDTDLRKVGKYMSAYVGISLFTALLSLFLLDRLGVFYMLPEFFSELYREYPIAFAVLFTLCVLLTIGIFCLKSAAIGAIRLYQHYAPEEVRRRCLFKPTCSEYAILAIQKYGIIIGLFKAYIRLFKKCRGNIYRIDDP